MDKRRFHHDLLSIAVPVTLQCLLQSSFGIADQIMVGQLGSVSIAAIGFAGKFSGLCSTVINAVVPAASIMLSPYVGSTRHSVSHWFPHYPSHLSFSLYRYCFLLSLWGSILQTLLP